MRICMIHGYLLTGTGSNIFVSNLVRHFCARGHDVLLLCQERGPQTLDFISRHRVFDPGNRNYTTLFERDTPYPGKCSLYNPDLCGLLPVYVYDEYPGFTVKPFTGLEITEIENHILQNLKALETVYAEHHFDLMQTNHVIMSPVVARRLYRKHDVPYYISLHGSALNFSVKNDRRLLPYAKEALLDAGKIFAVSNHNRLEAVTFFKEIAPAIEKKFVVVPAGVDVELFRIHEHPKRESISALKTVLKERVRLLPRGKTKAQKLEFLAALDETSSVTEVDALVARHNRVYTQGHPDKDINSVLDRIDWEKDWVLLFVGKYLWTKGIQMVLSSLPMVLRRISNLHLLLVGFGSYREELEALVYALGAGRRELFRTLIEKSISQMGPGDDPALRKPFKFLDALAERRELKSYFDTARDHDIAGHVHFLGALSHQELSYLLPCADGFVAASICPEAFGMVSIEALACGVLPIVSNQTGLKEIVDLVSGIVDTVNKTPRVDINEEMIFNIADNITHNIETADLRNLDFKRTLRQLTLDNFSWDSIAGRYLKHYTGGKDNQASPF